MEECINLIGHGVDTLILNVRYSDSKSQPVKQELDEKLAQELDYLQGEARQVETAVATDWAFQDVLLFVEPHGAEKQWRWLLTSRLLNVAVSRGKFNDIIAQVRFSSEYLWSQAWCGDALCKVHEFLMSVFGEHLYLQLSEVHLGADVVGYDFSQCNYETQFVTRVRKNEAICGAESVALDCHRVSTLAFSKHKALISCSIYNKPLKMGSISHLFKRLRERTGIDDKRVSPHQCRRYMATMQLAAGRSPLDVQRQMGHTTLTMTNHYASLNIQHLKRSHDAYSPLRAKQESVNRQGIGTGYWEME